MGRGPHKKQVMKVRSFRLGENEESAIRAFADEIDTDQSTALRYLIQYGILYYSTMDISPEE